MPTRTVAFLKGSKADEKEVFTAGGGRHLRNDFSTRNGNETIKKIIIKIQICASSEGFQDLENAYQPSGGTITSYSIFRSSLLCS